MLLFLLFSQNVFTLVLQRAKVNYVKKNGVYFMKKLLTVLIIAMMLLAMAACGSKETTKKDRLAEIKERGYIEFTTEPYWAPNEFIDPSKSGDDKYIGVDIELAKVIADRIGVELKIIPLEFSAVLTSITEGKYDMAISAIAWSPLRQEAMNLSNGYEFDEDTGYGFLVRIGDEDKYNSPESLKDAVVVTQSGSVQEGIYRQYVKECKELKMVGSMTDAYLAVSEGKADVCITAISSGQLYAEANGGLTTCDFEFDVDKQMKSTVVALPLEGTDSLMEIVNEVIGELEAAGQFQAWSDYYKEYAKTLGLE